MIRKLIAAAALAFPFSILAVGPAAATQNHEDPCPGQHVQVYNENSFVEIPHFVCASDLRGPKGETGEQGPKGEPGKDGKDGANGETGPVGLAGDVGPTGADGAAGPAGQEGAQGNPGTPGLDGATGAAGPAGDAGAAGPRGEAGPAGDSGAVGPKGKAGVSKTIIVNPDGTTQTIEELPATGGDETTLKLAALGVGLTALGTSAVVLYRRRK